jgi:hypothetical protein
MLLRNGGRATAARAAHVRYQCLLKTAVGIPPTQQTMAGQYPFDRPNAFRISVIGGWIGHVIPAECASVPSATYTSTRCK